MVWCLREAHTPDASVCVCASGMTVGEVVRAE